MYLNSWFVSNFYTNTTTSTAPDASSSPKKKEIITTPDDYGFFCDIENMEPDETIEYTVVYHNRSDFYHVCRRIIRKSDNQTKIEIPQVRQYIVQMVKPTPKSTSTSNKSSSHENIPSVTSSFNSSGHMNEKEENKYRRKCDVTFPSHYYYILYFLFISAAIITSLVIELDK